MILFLRDAPSHILFISPIVMGRIVTWHATCLCMNPVNGSILKDDGSTFVIIIVCHSGLLYQITFPAPRIRKKKNLLEAGA